MTDLRGWPVPLQYAARFLCDSATPAFLGWGTDDLLLLNDAARTLLGVDDVDSVDGAASVRPLAQTWPAAAGVLAPAIERALAGESFQIEQPTRVLAPRGADGWLTLAFAPVRTLDGAVLGFSCSIGDAGALREAEAKFRVISDAMPQMVWSTLPDGYHDYYNGRWYNFTGMREGDTDGERWATMFHADDREAAWAAWRHALATGTPYEIEYRLRHHSGAWRWVLGRALPMHDAEGRIVRWMGTCTDIDDHKRNEEALHDAQLRLSAALGAGEIGTWTYDLLNDRVVADRNLATIFGVDEEAAAGGALAVYLARVHPDDLVHTRACIEDAVATGAAYECTYRVRGEDGSWRHVLARGKVTLDAAGRAAWLPGAVLDITRQKRAEAALVQSESRFRRLAESNVIGIMRFRLDGAIFDANQAVLDMLGYTRADLERGALGSYELTPDEWRAATARAMEQLRTSGRMENLVKEYLRKDGSRASVQMAAITVDEPPTEGLAVLVDISPIQAARRALQDSEARFRAIADNIPQLAWMTEADGQVAWYNNRWCEYTGLTLAQARGWGWRAVHHPDHVEAVSARYLDHIRRGAVWEDTFPMRGRDGRYRWFLSRAVPIRDDHGAIVRWFGTNTDVTAQRESADALRDADRRKDEFLAMLAHELRNPLAPIVAAAEFLRVGKADDARIRQVTAIIARQAGHMTGLIDDLLDVSRVTRGLVTLERGPARLADLIGEAVEQVRPQIDAKRHALALDLPPGDFQVFGDHKRLVQIFANLLGNAAKYTHDGGRIAVEVRAGAVDVEVAVCDNGIGMSAALVAQAFELFSQGERSADRAQGGLGIGLALVRSLVELHDGSVSVHSAGAGQGSRFAVVLPRYRGEAGVGAGAVAPQAAAGTAPATPLNVLIVDDNVDAARILGMVIEAAGHRTTVLHSPGQALDHAATHPVDVAVLDIGLPEFDGHELARRLRALPGLGAVALLAVSGYGQAQDRDQALAAGFDRHFVKPVRADDILQVLADVARTKPPRRARESGDPG
jgi:PAS domain S-box-containing protein